MRSSALLLERRAFLAGFGALAATLAICPSPMIARAAARDTIYQRVWDADQATNGIPAIARDQAGDAARGFVNIEAAINGARYQVKLYRSPDGQSVRTFFPRFLGLA
jgi:hypothetical protein